MNKAKKPMLFSDFLENNEELVNDYLNAVGEDLWGIPSSDIDSIVNDISKSLKISKKTIVSNCINIAIETKTPLLDVLDGFSSTSKNNINGTTLLQKYFLDVSRIYEENNNNYDIEFTYDNRDALIGMNLKSVIAIAKTYQGNGVDLEDLISAGNEGLCHAFNKYDPKKATLKYDLLKYLDELPDELSKEHIKDILEKYITYGNAKKIFINKFLNHDNPIKKSAVVKWVNKNIENAKFNSVACQWIKAYIINEINATGRLVKKPKSELDKDKLESGSYKKEIKINLDAPIKDENGSSVAEIFSVDDDTISEQDKEESYYIFKHNLNTLLTGVKSRDRRILLKRFGIGMIRPMEPNEIAAQEELSVARISQIIQSTIKQMQENQKLYNVDGEVMYEALSKIMC